MDREKATSNPRRAYNEQADRARLLGSRLTTTLNAIQEGVQILGFDGSTGATSM